MAEPKSLEISDHSLSAEFLTQDGRHPCAGRVATGDQHLVDTHAPRRMAAARGALDHDVCEATLEPFGSDKEFDDGEGRNERLRGKARVVLPRNRQAHVRNLAAAADLGHVDESSRVSITKDLARQIGRRRGGRTGVATGRSLAAAQGRDIR